MAEIFNYKVAASPHSLDPSNTRRIMLDVLIALLPCLVCGVVFFGLYSLLLVVICVLACFLSEQIYNLIRKKPFTFDLSAFVTGLILGLNLPPRAPWYIPVIGGVFAIIVVKMLFGGLGKNFANPAATARVFLLLAYSTIMTQYIAPDVAGNILSADLVTAPTYLGGGTAALAEEFWGVQGYWGYVLQLLFGFVGGSIGETCKLAVLAGGAYLIARRVVDWRIPLVYLLTAAVMVLACYGSASEILLQLLSGGMLFGAVFMATDYATSPKWKYNRIIYAVGLGVLTVIIRRFGTYPEGTSLAILIMNLLVPVMDKYLLPVRFGQMTKAGKPYPQVMKWGMRGVSLALVLALAVAAPLVNYTEVSLTAGTYTYIQNVRRNFGGGYEFTVQGEAYLSEHDYTQPLEYIVKLDGAGERVTEVVPVTQSTMGYVAELSYFVGQTYEQIVARTDWKGTDAETSATRTNLKLKDMVIECFTAYHYELTDYETLPYAEGDILRAEKNGSLYRFTVRGEADLSVPGQYEYIQQLEYAVTIDAETGEVKYIATIRESTMGYSVDRDVFLGKTAEEIAGLTDEQIKADTDTGATITTVSVRGMIGKCFDALAEVNNG